MSDDSDDRDPRISSTYPLARLERALRAALEHEDPELRRRARARAERWRAVIEGMAHGELRVGSRRPVAEAPAWVTLEVAHGGFATGSFLAGGPLLEHERELLAGLPAELPGAGERARLNTWFLSDAGQRRLLEALRAGDYHLEQPEEGALLVVAALLERGRDLEALELCAELRPFMDRLRFYPRFEARPQPAGACVRRLDVAQLVAQLRALETPAPVATMNEALSLWSPLLDELVALWLETVEGPAPRLEDVEGEWRVTGGWPCRRWPDDWSSRRAAWLAAYARAVEAGPLCAKHRHPKSNFTRLREALEACPEDSAALDGRAVGWIRRALANARHKHGSPGSPAHAQLRRRQAEILARPTKGPLAELLVARLADHDGAAGLSSLEPLVSPVRADEHPRVPAGASIPASLRAKLARALEAPIPELIDRGVIDSAEVLAELSPQISSQVAAAGFDDAELSALFARIYAAFRRRRSLLLLDLQRQVGLDELPWVAALEPLRGRSAGARAVARRTLELLAATSLAAFPHSITPNPLVRELASLATQAELELPLVEELAADIFMGQFTSKWVAAALRASALLEGTLYARYYDLPAAAELGRPDDPAAAEAFGRRCRARAAEAQDPTGRGGEVARAGTVIEQSQILTTHNLAALVDELDLRAKLARRPAELAGDAFAWILRRLALPIHDHRARLRRVKNAAYAWRQAIFWLSLSSPAEQREAVDALEGKLAARRGQWVEALAPACAGLRMIVEGRRFDGEGRGQDLRGRRARRWLGWSVGPHWLLEGPR